MPIVGTDELGQDLVAWLELYSQLASCAMPTGDEGTDLDMGDLGSLGEVVADLGADLAAAPAGPNAFTSETPSENEADSAAPSDAAASV